MVERGAGGPHERVFVVRLANRFAAFAEGAGVGRKDDQPGLGEVLRVGAVVAVQGIGHGGDVPATRGHVLAAAAVPVRRDHNRSPLAGPQIVRQQRVEGHDDVGLGVNLHAVPHVAVARDRLGDDGLRIGVPHAGNAGDGGQVAARGRAPGLKGGRTSGVGRHPSRFAVEPRLQLRVRRKEARDRGNPGFNHSSVL